MFIRKKSGQSTLEYIVLIGFVTAALIAMGVYMKRGISGRIRSASDDIGDQYSPGHTTSTFTTTTDYAQSETTSAHGASTTNITENTQSKSGNENIEGLDSERWNLKTE
jgi:Flp pilus assembly pilin Flp